ncbi:formate dehydrogenase [Streptomyces sp. SPB78]|nr:formate dehydrogenase [Streptomyces sp. SPB78]
MSRRRCASSSPPNAPSCAGRWASRSTSTPCPRSARSSTSCCCGATSAAPARASAPCAGTPTCKATARWASSNAPRPPSSTPWSASSASPRPARTATTSSAPSARCATARRRSSSRWAATSSPRRRTPTSPRPRCAAPASPCTSPRSSTARTSSPGARALILPALGRTERDVQAGGEQFVTVEDSMGMVHASRGRLAPASPALLSEPAIVARLARAVRPASPLPWEEFAADYGRVRDRIARVVPGFEDFNARVAHTGGFALPHAPRDERRFPTATGKANFTAAPVEYPRLPAGRLLLQTLRSHDQYNTTIYGLDDRYRGITNGRRVVLVHPEDATALGYEDGAYADLVSEWRDGTERRAPRFRVVHYPTARGCAAAYYPETNVLVPLDATADTSNTPASKSLVVRLEPSRTDAPAD